MCAFFPACLNTTSACKFLHLCTGYFPERGDPSCIDPDCALDHPTHNVLVAAKNALHNDAAVKAERYGGRKPSHF